MTGLPKFVRDQMGRTPAPTSHPDANILTAFNENALSGKERQQVVEHLAACSDCREIIFLSQPETVETQKVLAPKTRRFTWMAWASAAAVVVVVASAVILQHEQVTKVQPPATVATTTTPPPEETKSAETSNKLAFEAPSAVEKDRKEMVASASKIAVPKINATPPKPLVTTKPTASDESFAVLPSSVPASAPPSATGQNAIIGGAISQQNATGPEQRNVSGQLQQQAQLSSNQPQGPSNSANANSANLANMNDNLAKAEAAPAAKVQKKQARADALHGVVTGYAVGATPIQPAARAHWQISSTGTLERSYVADQWTPVLAQTGAKFHVVSVIGNTIWAGGEHGALYVSRDGGSAWSSVKLETAETITSIHFSDDSHGTLQTANGLTWKTLDGGNSWEKQ